MKSKGPIKKTSHLRSIYLNKRKGNRKEGKEEEEEGLHVMTKMKYHSLATWLTCKGEVLRRRLLSHRHVYTHNIVVQFSRI